MLSLIIAGFVTLLSLAGAVRAWRRGGGVVWWERVRGWLGLALVSLALVACSPAQRASGASWFDRAMTTICAEYPVLLRPRVLEIADSAPPEPAAEMDAGVDGGASQ
jgi:hypothetical protein